MRSVTVLQNKETGHKVEIKQGISWWTVFFGAFVMMSRGMVGKGFLWLALQVCTFGLAGIYLVFKINDITAKHFRKHGYEPVT